METLYYALGTFVYIYFFIKLFLTFLAGDVGMDINVDGDVDFDVGSLFSFKGILHFLLGFTGYMCYQYHHYGYADFYSYIIAIGLGIAVMFMLAISYIICMKANYEPKILQGQELIGRRIIVNLFRNKHEDFYYYYASYGTTEIIVRSNNELVPGTEYIISNYINNYYQV